MTQIVPLKDVWYVYLQPRLVTTAGCWGAPELPPALDHILVRGVVTRFGKRPMSCCHTFEHGIRRLTLASTAC